MIDPDPEVEPTPEEYTWLDDEYYDQPWSWIDEGELE